MGMGSTGVEFSEGYEGWVLSGDSVPGVVRVLDPETPAVKHDNPIDLEREKEITSEHSKGENLQEWREKVSGQIRDSGLLDDRLAQLEDFELDQKLVPSTVYPVNSKKPHDRSPIADILLFQPGDAARVEQKLAELHAIEKDYLSALGSSANPRSHLPEYHRKWGEILGYNECDVRPFAKSFTGDGEDTRRSEHDFIRDAIDEEIWAEILEGAFSQDSEGFLEDPPESLYVLPTPSFYPHSADCSNAIEMGKRVEGQIETEEGRNLYRRELLYNHLNILTVAYLEDLEDVKEYVKDLNKDAREGIELLVDIRSRAGRNALHDILIDDYTNRNC